MEWNGFYFPIYCNFFAILNYLLVTQLHNHLHSNHKNLVKFLVWLYTPVYLHCIVA